MRVKSFTPPLPSVLPTTAITSSACIVPARISASRPEASCTVILALLQLFLDAEDSRSRRARVARPATALVDQHEELEQHAVEGFGVLDVDGVARARQHREARGGDAALHEKRGLDAGIVLV